MIEGGIVVLVGMYVMHLNVNYTGPHGASGPFDPGVVQKGKESSLSKPAEIPTYGRITILFWMLFGIKDYFIKIQDNLGKKIYVDRNSLFKFLRKNEESFREKQFENVQPYIELVKGSLVNFSQLRKIFSENLLGKDVWQLNRMIYNAGLGDLIRIYPEKLENPSEKNLEYVLNYAITGRRFETLDSLFKEVELIVAAQEKRNSEAYEKFCDELRSINLTPSSRGKEEGIQSFLRRLHNELKDEKIMQPKLSGFLEKYSTGCWPKLSKELE